MKKKKLKRVLTGLQNMLTYLDQDDFLCDLNYEIHGIYGFQPSSKTYEAVRQYMKKFRSDDSAWWDYSDVESRGKWLKLQIKSIKLILKGYSDS